MPAGWYDDPWNPQYIRWWDGTQWTPHTAPKPWSGFSYAQPVTPADLSKTQAWARWASIAIVLNAVIGVAQLFAVATFLHDQLHSAFHGNGTHSFTFTFGNAPFGAGDFSASRAVEFWLQVLAANACLIVFAVWLFRSAEVARRLGLPARRQAGWAFAFWVPVINFWFPYQVAVDQLPPGDAQRPSIGWWWAWYLIQSAGGVAVGIASFGSTTTAVAVAAAVCPLPIVAAVQGVKVIRIITERHAALVSQR